MTILNKLLSIAKEYDPTLYHTYFPGSSRVDENGVVRYITPGLYELARKAHEDGKDHFHARFDIENGIMVECDPDPHYVLHCKLSVEEYMDLRELSSTLDHHDSSSPGNERPQVHFSSAGGNDYDCY